MAGLLTATVVGIVAPILVYVWAPPAKGQRKAALPVTLDKPLDQIQPGDAVQIQAPNNSAFVMADGGGDNAPGELAFGGYVVNPGDGKSVQVFAINCSHLGCSIGLNSAAKSFDCPCHGSRFNLDGSVLHGPATAPLAHLAWKQTSDPQKITVDGLVLGS